MITEIAIMIEARRGRQGKVRDDHPRVFREYRPAVAGNLTDRGDAGRLFVRDTEGVIQFVVRKVDA